MREHGTTHQQPLTLFRLAEQKELKLLPPVTFEIATWHRAKVAHDCHIQAGGTLYSVPYRYVGKTVDVKLGTKVIEVYLDWELVKTHLRGAKRQRVTDWNDYPPPRRRQPSSSARLAGIAKEPASSAHQRKRR